MPSVAAHCEVAFEPEPHQMRSRSPSECGSTQPLPFEQVEELFGVASRHVRVRLAWRGRVAEMTPTIDHLLGRSAADAELQAAARDQVGGGRIFHHVRRVLVAHVDHGRADLDPARSRADCRKQREG